MRVRTGVTLSAIALISSSCAPLPPTQAAPCQIELTALAQDPESRARSAVASGTPYFLGVQGYSVTFPGVDDLSAVRQVGYRILEGTSDVVQSGSCRSYQGRAKAYAEQFNRTVISLTLGS